MKLDFRYLLLVIGAMAIASIVHAAQRPVDIVDPIGSSRENICIPTARDYCGADKATVDAVLASPEALWSFVTSPEARFGDRRVAALKGAETAPLEWLVRIDAGQRDLADAGFRIAYIPEDDARPRPRGRRFDGEPMERTFFGHRFTVPDRWMAHSEASSDIPFKPWPLQVSAALDLLYREIVRRHSATQVVELALRLPCGEPAGAQHLQALLISVAARDGYAPASSFGAVRNLIRSRRNEYTVVQWLQILHGVNPSMTRILVLDLLANGILPATTALFSRSASVVLAAAPLIIQENPLAPAGTQTRAELAHFIQQTALTGASSPSTLVSPRLPALEAAIAEFSGWFMTAKPQLELAAVQERILLDELRALMDTPVCRTQ